MPRRSRAVQSGPFPRNEMLALSNQIAHAKRQIQTHGATAKYDSAKLAHAKRLLEGIESAIQTGKHNAHSLQAIQQRIDELSTKPKSVRTQSGYEYLINLVRGPRNYSTRGANNRRLNHRTVHE